MTAGGSSVPEVQRLVATLVASKPGGRIAEIGTAFGVGARAIVEALSGGATFVTVEVDPERAAQAREALAGTPAELLVGDWRELLPPRGPFDLVFADAGVGYELVAGLLAPGGIVVKDDLVPGVRRPDVQTFLTDDRLIAAEILVSPEMAAIVAVRR